MDQEQFFTASRLVIVAGKGGVGKTTVAATLALAAARCGLDVLVVEVEGKRGIASMFGAPDLRYEDLVLAEHEIGARRGRVRARTITPREALSEYLHQHGMRRISNRLMASGAMDMVATAVPGIEDLLLLGKVKQLERSGTADLVILDGPPAGHAITMLQSPAALLDAVRVGPVRTQATDVLDMLRDGTRTRVILVTLPEETPVNELIEAAYTLEDRVLVKLGPIVANALYRDIAGFDEARRLLHGAAAESEGSAVAVLNATERDVLVRAADFRDRRLELQHAQVQRLAAALPLPQLRLPVLLGGEIQRTSLDLLSNAMLDGVAALRQH